MSESEQRLKQDIDGVPKQAEDTDAAEDELCGKGMGGDDLPEELSRRESRLKKLQQAMAELEEEAKEKAEQQRAEAVVKLAARREQEQQTGKKRRGREPKVLALEQLGCGITGIRKALEHYSEGKVTSFYQIHKIRE